MAEKKAEIARMQTEAKDIDALLTDQLVRIPNLPAEDVPDGKDENDNVEVKRWGTPRDYDFEPKEHFEIASVQNGMDFETAVRERIPILSILLNNFSMAIELKVMPVSTEKYRSTDISGDYAAMARAFGGFGERVTEPGEIAAAIKRGIAATEAGQPALLEFITSKEVEVSRL